VLWVGIALLLLALAGGLYRLVRAGLLTAGIDERQSKIVASVLVVLTGVYGFIKTIHYLKG